MNQIAANLARVKARITESAVSHGRDPHSVQLLAVSKTKPVEDIRAAMAAGQRDFGENYLQDATPKIAALSGQGLTWHFIGRIQSNKTVDIATLFDWVHGLSSLKHAQRLSAQRGPDKAPLQLCIQVNTSGEDSKGGVTPAELPELARAVAGLPQLRLRGLMTMPDPKTDRDVQRQCFAHARRLLEGLKPDIPGMDTLSMGMSGDMDLAIAEGATLVRIGSAIFGARR